MKYDVFYSPFQYFEENNIELDDKDSHKDFYYSLCPVWGHMFDRTFIGYSPIDFKLRCSDNILEYQVNDEEIVEIDLEDIEGEEYDDNNVGIILDDLKDDFHVIQLTFTGSFFWTKYEQEYLWFEFLDHPYTYANNNFEAVCGWFNLANHPRSTSLGIKYRPDEGIDIEKGDPLYRLRFYTDNMDDKPNLIKKEASENMTKGLAERRKMMSGDRKFLNKMLFDKDARKGCPFHNS